MPARSIGSTIDELVVDGQIDTMLVAEQADAVCWHGFSYPLSTSFLGHRECSRMGVFAGLGEDVTFAIDIHFGLERNPRSIELEHVVGVAGKAAIIPVRGLFEDGSLSVGNVFDEVIEKVETKQLLW